MEVRPGLYRTANGSVLEVAAFPGLGLVIRPPDLLQALVIEPDGTCPHGPEFNLVDRIDGGAAYAEVLMREQLGQMARMREGITGLLDGVGQLERQLRICRDVAERYQRQIRDLRAADAEAKP